MNSQIAVNHIVRGLILGISQAAGEGGAGIPIIKAMLAQEGHELKESDILAHCRYLEGKGLVRVENIRNPIQHISRDIAHITPKGIDVLEGTEQVEGIILGGE